MASTKKSAFESRQLQKASGPFRSVGEKLRFLSPGLEWTLERAGMRIDAVTYLSITFYIAFSVAVTTFIGILLPSYLAGKEAVGLPLAIGVSVGLFLFMTIYMLMVPKVKLRKRAWMIEQELGYAIKDLEIQTSAGIPVYNAIIHVANGGYGACSEEFQKVVKRVQSGESLTKALDNVGMRTASVFLRRIIWQIVNALYAGSNVSVALAAISGDLTKDKENKIRAYGQSMNLWGLLYMLMVIVLPSQGITLLIVLTSLVDIFSRIDKNFVFGGILIFMFIFQFLFIGYIKNRRPIV